MSLRGHRKENGVRNHDNERQVLMNDGVDPGKQGTMRKTILQNLKLENKYLQMWNMMFVVSCTIAVSVDPLFFYLPVINEETITDAWRIAKRYLLSYYLIDILAILPIPQVVVPIIFSEMRGSGFLNKRKFLNAVVLFQYVPRVLRIYLSWRKLISTDNNLSRIVWVKAAFNFFLYILASHVLGAFWYFFSIERETACWHIACRNHIGCNQSSFNCRYSVGNQTFLNDYCSVETPNAATPFNFGIFIDAIKSGTVASNDIPKKFAYCFWWGLRNLSSLGQNLQTSTYIWENCFAVSISIFGFLLILYFIGNLQTYMQLATQRSEEIIQKLKSKELDVKLWIHRNELPPGLEYEIMHNIPHILEEKKDIDAEKPLLHLPIELKRKIKHHLCEPLLKKVPMLGKKNQLLQMICDYLKPVYYNEHSYIVREGEPLDAAIFVTQGIIWSFATSNGEGTVSSGAQCIEKGHFYGQDLLDWALNDSPTSLDLSKLPISTKTVKTHAKVEGFALMANDLKTVVSKWKTEAASALQAAWRRRSHPEKKNEKPSQSASENKN
uniref:Cyclic nucleotide-binding domain-containing protein n=1 Tax=Quercus lobata TaxID=97700 RepID=A0A7N2RAF5_QUELO